MTPDRRRAWIRLPRRRSLWIAFLLLPAALVMSVFVLWPLISALRFSFYSSTACGRRGSSASRISARCCSEHPFSDWTYNAFFHNVIVFFALMVFENGTAFLLAFALLKALPGHRVHQVIVFLPVVLSAVIVGFLWKLFLHPLFGLVNQALALVGIQGRAWLGDERTALGSIVFANIWHWLGFPTLRASGRHAAHQQGSAGGRPARRRRGLCAAAQDHLAADRAKRHDHLPS